MTERLKERIAEEWAMLDPVDPLRGLLSDVMDVLAQPAPPPPECKTDAEQTAYAFGWWKALESVRTEQPAQEPVAWADMKVTDRDVGLSWTPGYFHTQPLYTAPQQQEPRNFCSRCGKRTADLTVIHTCTPPEGGHQ